jgi:uncharacterized protein YcfJ
MYEICEEELRDISAGKKLFSKVFNVISGAIIGGVIEGIAGAAIGGPVGFAAGFAHGVYDGAAAAVIYEGANGLTEITHPEFGVDP